jgi:hypothetical protein
MHENKQAEEAELRSPCAQSYMQPYEHKAVTHYNAHNPTDASTDILQCWYRQADDTFTSIHGDHIILFHTWLNSIHPDIQWTYEIEKEGRLNMLDISIIHAPYGSLSFEVYRKPTHTGQYITHDSNAPRSSLLSTVRALTCRADKIPSTPQARAAEHTRVRIELATNGYTMDTYNRGRYRERKSTQTAPAAQETTNPTPTDNISQAPTAHNLLHTPQEKRKHLGHISNPYCKGISEPFSLKGII